MDLKKFMSEERLVNRWKILLIGLIGAFCGAIITTVFLLHAVVS